MLSQLTKDGTGKYEKTINNAVIVLENDPLLKGRIVTDEFANCGMVLGRMPWDQREEKRRWKDVGRCRILPLCGGVLRPLQDGTSWTTR